MRNLVSNNAPVVLGGDAGDGRGVVVVLMLLAMILLLCVFEVLTIQLYYY